MVSCFLVFLVCGVGLVLVGFGVRDVVMVGVGGVMDDGGGCLGLCHGWSLIDRGIVGRFTLEER